MNRHSTISNEGDPLVREAEEAFAALQVLDDNDEIENENDVNANVNVNDNVNDNDNDNESAPHREETGGTDTFEDEELKFLQSLEGIDIDIDIDRQPLVGLSSIRIDYDDENENDDDSLALFSSEIIDFLANGDGFDVGESIETRTDEGIDWDTNSNSNSNSNTHTTANPAVLVSDNEEDPKSLVPEPGVEKDTKSSLALAPDTITNTNTTPNTSATSATTAAASAETKNANANANANSNANSKANSNANANSYSALPPLELDFENDPFLRELLISEQGGDNFFQLVGDALIDLEENGGCCVGCDCGVKESAAGVIQTQTEERARQHQHQQQHQPHGSDDNDDDDDSDSDEKYPLPKNSFADIDLETEILYKELAKMSLARETGTDPIAPACPQMQKPSTALELLMEPTMDDFLGNGTDPPFAYLSCQPCSPSDDGLDLVAGAGEGATTPTPNSIPNSNPTQPDATQRPNVNVDAEADADADADVPTTMELLMDPTLNFDMDGMVGSDGLPFYLMCQPCDMESANALFGGVGSGNGNGNQITTADDSGNNNSSSNYTAPRGDPFSSPKGGLPPISEDQAMNTTGDYGGEATTLRDKEQYVRDLKALYSASASASASSTKRVPERDDLTPLDHNVYGNLDDNDDGNDENPSGMVDDFEQLAQQLQREQDDLYRRSLEDATHWAGAFGVDLESTTEEGESNAKAQSNKKSPIRDTAKSGLGHKEVIYGASFSDDGKYVATASQDASVCIWEVATHRLLSTLRGHDVNFECLRVDWANRSWAEDVLDRSVLFANLIASGGADGTVKLWACRDKNGRDDNGLRTIDNQWKCEYTLDHSSLLSKANTPGTPAGEKDAEPNAKVKVNDENDSAKRGSDDKPQIYSLQFIDDWKVFNKEMLQHQYQCSRHANENSNASASANAKPEHTNEVVDDEEDPVANSFLMTSSDDFIHLWEVRRHSLDQQLALDGRKVRILQEKITLKEVMSLHFGPLDQFGYGVTACSITGEGLQLPPPPTKNKNKNSALTDGSSTAFGGERNPDSTVFVFDAAYSPTSGLLGVALADGSLRLVNGRGTCISVIRLPGNQSHLTSFCWDATGNRLATCVGTGHLITWSLDPESHLGGNYNTVATCTAIFEGGHQSGRPLYGTRFCGGDDQNLLLSWGVDGKLCMWYSNARGNIYDPVAILKDDVSYPIFAVQLSPSEESAVVGGGSEGGFIGVPLHFYSIPPLTDKNAEIKEVPEDSTVTQTGVKQS